MSPLGSAACVSCVRGLIKKNSFDSLDSCSFQHELRVVFTNTNKPNDTNLEPTALLLERLSTFGRFEKFVFV